MSHRNTTPIMEDKTPTNELGCYSCSGNSLCVIFDMHIYSTVENSRYGSEIDRFRMYKLFKTLGFWVHVVCNPSKKIVEEEIKKVKDVCVQNNIQILVTVILSHGEKGNIIHTVDSQGMNIFDDFVKKLTTNDDKNKNNIINIKKTHYNSFMPGKPKLFIIQACRGPNVLIGHSVDVIEVLEPKKLPFDVDTIIVYSTLPGALAQRHTIQGTPFICFLSNVFLANYKKYDVVTMLTILNNMIAKEKELNKEFGTLMTSFRSYLTKRLFLPVSSSLEEIKRSTIDEFCPKANNLLNKLDLKLDDFKQGGLKVYGNVPNRHRRVCLIFNQIENNSSELNKINQMFQDIGFTVISKENLYSIQIEEFINQTDANQNGLGDKRTIKSLIVIVLSFGVGHTIICKNETDKMDLTDMISPFVKCKDLKDCPKVFIFHAPNGTREDINEYDVADADDDDEDDADVDADADDDDDDADVVENDVTGDNADVADVALAVADHAVYPRDADVLVMYSATLLIDGAEKGFIDELCDVFSAHYKHMDVVSMLTIVNNIMSQKEENILRESKGKMPCWFVSRLTGLLYLADDPVTLPQYNQDVHDLIVNKHNNAQPINIFRKEKLTLINVQISCDVPCGVCIIIDQSIVDENCQITNDDVDRIKLIFSKYKFRVTVYKHLDKISMQNKLDEESKNSKKLETALVVIVLCHCNNGTQILASHDFNDCFPLENLIKPFSGEKCSWKGKPKCFLIQGLCEDQIPSSSNLKVNLGKDMLLAYAMTPANDAEKYSDFEKFAGSVFIREMCCEMENNYIQSVDNGSQNWEVENVKKLLLDLIPSCKDIGGRLHIQSSLRKTLRWSFSYPKYI